MGGARDLSSSPQSQVLEITKKIKELVDSMAAFKPAPEGVSLRWKIVQIQMDTLGETGKLLFLVVLTLINVSIYRCIELDLDKWCNNL